MKLRMLQLQNGFISMLLDKNFSSVSSFRFDCSLGFKIKIFIFFISIVFSWKLFRLVFSEPIVFWLHVVLIMILFLWSLLVFAKNIDIYRRSQISLAVILFVSVMPIRWFFSVDSVVDTFTISMLSFSVYFLLYRIFYDLHDLIVFSSIEYLMVLIVVFNVVNYIDANFLSSPLFSLKTDKLPYEMTSTGHATGSFVPFLSKYIVRPSGVSGTDYASSGLLAAISIYFLIVKRKYLFVYSYIILLFWGVATPILALLVSVSIYLRKKWYFILFVLLSIVLGSFIASVRGGVSLSVYLNIGFLGDFFTLFFGFIFGEGKTIGSVVTELRIVNMLFGLGLIGSFLLFFMMYKYYCFVKFNVSKEYFGDKYLGGGFFIFTLLLSSFHYNSFFIYPNVLLVVAFIALVSARIHKQSEFLRRYQ